MTMFHSKSDIDKHVSALLNKSKNEAERNLRCFHIAKLYHKIQDYESVQRYINMYLNAREDSAGAHKLLGQAFEGLGEKAKAISAYTKSLKIDPDQSDLVYKVCELLCDKDVEFDPVLARYWADKASVLYPHSLPVLTLKEKLLSSDTTISSKDLEVLLHAELKAKPTDVTVRIKLLKMYAESGRTELALNHAYEVESRQAHVNSFAWYKCANDIFETYNRDHFAKCCWEFYIHWLTSLDRMCLLSVTENLPFTCELSEAVHCVYSFDQALYYANQCPKKSEKFADFLKLMSTQLAYLLGIVLMKKAKKENSHWKETKRISSPLFILSANTPFKLDQSWTSSLKDSLQKVLEFWIHQVHCRQIQSGFLLLTLVKENQSEKMFLDKVSHFTASNWRRQVFEKAFSSISDRKTSTSHFLTGIEYAKFPLRIPSSNILKPTSFVSSFENTYFGSLHHLVWLGLRAIKKLPSYVDVKFHAFRPTAFKSLKFTINNLNNIGIETMNQLDVESFLYITVICTASVLEESKNMPDSLDSRPQVLPADISSPLCTPEQAKWWSNLCALVKGGNLGQISSNESMSDLRYCLQRGIEVIRGEGLPPFLTVTLAKIFTCRSALAKTIEEGDGCTARALYLYKTVYPTLERLVNNKSFFTASKINPLFEHPAKSISAQEAKSLFEDARCFMGSHYLNTGQYEKAVAELKGMKFPQGLFNLGLVYQKWAEHQMDGLKGEEITSELRCRHAVLATKARDYFLESKNLIKNDPKHLLHNELDRQISEVEDLLARIEPENGTSERDVNGASDGTQSYESGGGSPEPLQVFTNPRHRRAHIPTSTPHRSHEQKANRFNMTELIDLLSVQQSTNQLKLQEVLEQIRLITDKIDSLTSEQRAQRNLVENMTTRLNSFESEVRTSISEIKRPDLCNAFDEDDYNEILQYPGYSQYYNPPQRVVQNTAAPPPTVPYQYYSPRIDPLGFYSQQGGLPFSEGQQLPDFLRQQKVNQPLLHSLQPGISPSLSLASGIPGPSRIPAGAAMPSSVLLTTAETLSSVTPSVPPHLNVNIPTSHRFSSSASNVPHNFQIPLPPQPKPVLNIEERPIEEETPPPTYDPLPDYKPLVPLPNEIEVHTGEEDEEVLFERRAKLFRYVEKTWKERGVGNLKILKSKVTGKIRLLMRRDQVHKICANHFLTTDMELQPKANTENAWVWIANDFADEKIQPEKFCAKFKTKEDSDDFKCAFEKAREDLEAVRDVPSEPRETSVHEVREAQPPLFPSEPKSGAPVCGFSASFSTPTSAPTTTSQTTASSFFSSPFFFSQPSNKSLITGTEEKSPSSFFQPQATQTTTPFVSSNSFVFGGIEKKSPDKSVQPQLSQISTQPSKVGGFTFSLAQPKLKPPELLNEKPEPPKEPSPFVKFDLGLTTDKPKDSFSVFSSLSTQSKTELPNPFALPSSKSPAVSSSRVSKGDQGEKTENKQDENDMPKSPAPKDGEEGEADNFVPTANFQPVIPLPDLVDVKTGEEGELIVFEERAQLYRYCRDTKQWKERGLGQMKILKHPETGSYRLLMRREQVLKVCCNHRITKDITLKPMTTSERAFSWAAKDHSEDSPSDELFSVKFKKSEQANNFKEAFLKAQQSIATAPESPPKATEKLPLSSLVKKPPGSWTCSDCYVPNKADEDKCVACSSLRTKEVASVPSNQTSKTNIPPAATTNSLPILSELLKPKAGSWACDGCYVRNEPDSESCVSCSTPKPGTAQKTAQVAKPSTTFTFGIPETENSTQNKTPSTAFTFGTNIFGTNQKPDTGIFKTSENDSSSTITPFSIGSGFDFTSVINSSSNNSSEKSGFVFSSNISESDSNKEYSFGSKTFHFSMPAPNVPSSPGNTSQHDESGYDPEEEQDHVFKPVVPLPEKVDVVTGEENENVLYSQRAKLYRFDETTKEWKERGLGDVKILQHKETMKIRFLMRREPIMKVCLNHFLTPDLTLREKDSRSWLWYAADFSEGAQKNEKFVIKFKSQDIAEAFKDEVEKAKELSQSPDSSATIKHGKDVSMDEAGESSSSSDNDVIFVSEQKAPPELVKKALSLQLPANYYCYLDKPKCSGCAGCEPDDTEEESESDDTKNSAQESQNKTAESQSTFSKPLFGNVEPAPTIFGSSVVPPSSAGFSFAKAFNSPSDTMFGVPTTPSDGHTGLLFKNIPSFNSATTPQKSIFSGTSSPVNNVVLEKKDPPVHEGKGDSNETLPFVAKGDSFQSFSALSGSGSSFVTSGADFKWEGAGEPVFGFVAQKKDISKKPDSGKPNLDQRTGK